MKILRLSLIIAGILAAIPLAFAFLAPAAHAQGAELKFKVMDVGDFKVDMAALPLGQRLGVKNAKVVLSGGVVLMGISERDTSPVIINIESVDRDKRKHLVQKCEGTHCSATVLGSMAATTTGARVFAASNIVFMD